MNNQAQRDLRKELKSVGASESELTELSAVAHKLERLKDHNSSLIKTPSPKYQSKWSRLLPTGLLSLGGLLVGMALVIFSQTVLPGSVLYPVQKLSDKVSMSMDPNYRATIMMKRAQEVKQLIADHASSSLVLATLSDYQAEAATYKSVPANYSVFEYCKNNLQQAAAIAPSQERQAINKTLVSLDSA